MKKKVIAALAIGVALIGCAPRTQINSYVDQSLNKAALSSGGITVLPLLLGSSVKDANIPELRRELSRRTGESIKAYFPSAKVVPADQTLTVLDGNSLLDSYNTAANIFDTTGSLKSDVLNKITDITSTRYAILPYLQSATSTVNVGAYGIRSYSYDSSFSMVIWDKVQQKTVYEGSGTATLTNTLLKSYNILDAAYAAFDKAGAKISTDIK